MTMKSAHWKFTEKLSGNDVSGISLIIAVLKARSPESPSLSPNQTVLSSVMLLWQTAVIIHFGNEWAIFFFSGRT